MSKSSKDEYEWLLEPIETFKGMNHPEVVAWFSNKISELNRKYHPEYISFWSDLGVSVPCIYFRAQYIVDKETYIDEDWERDMYGVVLSPAEVKVNES